VVIAAPVGWEGVGRQCPTFDEGIHSACPLTRKVFIDISSFIYQRSYLNHELILLCLYLVAYVGRIGEGTRRSQVYTFTMHACQSLFIHTSHRIEQGQQSIFIMRLSWSIKSPFISIMQATYVTRVRGDLDSLVQC
jgi:hypothetical protein